VRIDAHQHYWRYDPARHGWITDEMRAIRRDFLPEQAAPLLAAAGIDGVIAVQADQTEAETDFLLALAEKNSLIRGVVGWIDLRAPDLDERLAQWKDRKALKGFRHIAQAEPDDFLARDDVARGVARLSEHGFSYDILIYPRQLVAAECLVSRCPGVRFVLDHCAKPMIVRGEITEWRAGLQRLARHANVCCKVSGLVTEAAPSRWTYADLVPYMDAAAEAFGADRLMFGSDWPVCLVAAEYEQVYDIARRFAERLTPIERDAVFGGTAARVYQLEA
jgi:L-fucono-1,5-lactonase